MRTTFIFLLGIAIALIISIQGKAQETQKYNAINFTGIESSIAGNIIVQISDSYSVEITSTNRNFLNAIKVEVDDNNVLCINSTEKHQKRIEKNETIVNITIPLLLSVVQNGVGNIVVKNEINAESISLEVSGVGNIDFSEGGKTRNIKIKSSGVGTIDAHNVQSVNGSVDISGVGKVMVNACNKIDGNLSGVGSLIVYGDALLNINKSGIGRVTRK